MKNDGMSWGSFRNVVSSPPVTVIGSEWTRHWDGRGCCVERGRRVRASGAKTLLHVSISHVD